ncbi:MAG TPA: F0F1 ATP synthase subunit gamma [Alphaproteobacteria bacterium]|nr:F0F1 ATP synthase subunit gamma [Alphaproteobacteria bacterium]
MPSLKDLKVRINSVKNTQKITSAMKMVAAAKLRRAQEQAEAARPYAERMERVLGSLAASVAGKDNAPALLAGSGKSQVHLLVVMTSDRGLCGAFNSSITRLARRMARELKNEGKTVKILAVGRKGRDQMRREFAGDIIGTVEDVAKPKLTYAAAEKIAERIRAMFEAGEFDVCTLIYNKFKSAITQIVTAQQLIPFAPGNAANQNADAQMALYEYEPDEQAILAELLPRNLGMQVYRALLENAASEQGARMSAMDSATRNAGDMINRLTITYNRSRQAYITKELIEIISGAEAL